MPLQFTKEDCKDPDRLERLLRRFDNALDAAARPQKVPSANEVALELAPFIRDQLKATGVAPLNLPILLPSQGFGLVLQDTQANRLALYPVANYEVGQLFFETDRFSYYVVNDDDGPKIWKYSCGMFSAAFGSRPTDLGTNDTNFLLWVSVYNHIMKWGGTAWVFTDSPGGYIESRAIAPPVATGYQLCDGTATTYLAISGADLAETAFTTTDENTAPAGVYHESIAAYTGVINAARSEER